MSDPIFPKKPKLHNQVPAALLTGDQRMHRISDEHQEAVENVPRETRQVMCMLYLAHTGVLTDSSGAVMYDLTPEELAQWLRSACEEPPDKHATRASIEALKTQGLARFWRLRECLVTKDIDAHSYRMQRGVVKVRQRGGKP